MKMEKEMEKRLRSPRKTLGGYAILPRLIDKALLDAEGKLPENYQKLHLLPGETASLDGYFLKFTGLNNDALRKAIRELKTDEKILAWVEKNAIPHTVEERAGWVTMIDAHRHTDPARIERRKAFYPEVSARVDVGKISVFDLIDYDEGRKLL